MTYAERIGIMEIRLSKAAFKTVWQYALESGTSGKSLNHCAKESIAAQAEAIRDALYTWANHGCNITDYLLEHGYIEPKTEEDA